MYMVEDHLEFIGFRLEMGGESFGRTLTFRCLFNNKESLVFLELIAVQGLVEYFD